MLYRLIVFLQQKKLKNKLKNIKVINLPDRK